MIATPPEQGVVNEAAGRRPASGGAAPGVGRWGAPFVRGIFHGDALPSAALLGFLALSTCFYGLSYFFPASTTGAPLPAPLRYVKEAAWLVILAVSFPALIRGVRRGVSIRDAGALTACQFVLVFGCLAVVHGFARGSERWTISFLKNFLFYSPALLLLLSLRDPGALAERVRRWWTILAAGQVVLGFLLLRFLPDALFWRDDPWNGFNPLVGGLANPNRFALFLNLALGGVLVSAVESDRPAASAGWTFVAALLALGVVYSGTTSQFIVTLGLLTYGYFYMGRTHRVPARRRAPVFASVAAVLLAFGLPLYRRTSVVESLLSVIGVKGDFTGPMSNSISNRIEEFVWIWNHARRADPLTLAIGDTAGRPMMIFDPQYGDVFVNAGLLGLASLLVLMVAGGLRGLGRTVERGGAWAGLHLAAAAFSATFIIDNGLYDFPTSFLFFLVFGLLVAAGSGPRARA